VKIGWSLYFRGFYDHMLIACFMLVLSITGWWSVRCECRFFAVRWLLGVV